MKISKIVFLLLVIISCNNLKHKNKIEPEDYIFEYIKKNLDSKVCKQVVFRRDSDSLCFYTFSVGDTTYFTTRRTPTKVSGIYPLYWKNMESEKEYKVNACVYDAFDCEQRFFVVTMFGLDEFIKNECRIIYRYNLAQDFDYVYDKIYEKHPELICLEGIFRFNVSAKEVIDYEPLIIKEDKRMYFE